MASGSNEEAQRLWVDSRLCARDEIERRKKSPFRIPGDCIQEHYFDYFENPANPPDPARAYIVDPWLGLNQRTFRLWIRYGGHALEDAATTKGWGLGHRRTVEAVLYILQGHGYSLIDGVKHHWEPGDFVSIPIFSWHKHFNEHSDDYGYIAATTGPSERSRIQRSMNRSHIPRTGSSFKQAMRPCAFSFQGVLSTLLIG